MTRYVIALVVIAALATAALLYSQLRPEPLKVSGFIEADEIRLGSRVGGRVQSVHVEEGQAVDKGAVLIELEPFDLLEKRRQAEAQLAEAVAEYERLHRGYRQEEIDQAKARRDQLLVRLRLLEGDTAPRQQEIAAAEALLNAAKAQRELAESTYRRNRAAGAAVDAQLLERSLQNWREAQSLERARAAELEQLKQRTPLEIAEAKARLAEAEAALRLLQAGYRPEQTAKARAAVDAAQAALATVERQIEELKIRTPVAGVVEAVELQPGDLVSPNSAVLSIMDTSKLWVRAYVPENRLNIQIGQRFRVTVDSYHQPFHGTVTFISRQAEFTPGNVQTPEERSKQVFRIKVTLDEEARRLLRPGMAADVWLESPED